nr:MAG: hypothetical protein [Microvirus sp.]
MEFKKAYDKVIDIPVCPGSKIYEWEFENEAGEMVKTKKNVFEEIQSYENLTNYKELIENYGLDNLPSGAPTGIYADVSNFGYDPDTAKQHIDSLVEEIRKALASQQTEAAKKVEPASSGDTEKI